MCPVKNEQVKAVSACPASVSFFGDADDGRRALVDTTLA